MTMEAAARALGALERNPAICDQLLAPLKRMTALQVSHRSVTLLAARCQHVRGLFDMGLLQWPSAGPMLRMHLYEVRVSRCFWCC